jgi:hypothetical protein
MSKDKTQQPPGASPLARSPSSTPNALGTDAGLSPLDTGGVPRTSPGVNGGTVTQHELNNGQFDQTGPVQLYGPTAAMFGVQSGGYYGGTPGSGTGSSANQPAGLTASPFASNTSSSSAPSPFAAPTGTPSTGSAPAQQSPLASNTNSYTAPPSPTPQVAPVNSGLASGLNAPPIDYSKIISSLNTSHVPSLVGGDALSQQMSTAQQAAYKQASGYLDPQWTNAQHDLTQQLANQGIPLGSEAYQRAMDEFNRNKTFAYSQAENAAVQQGNAAQAQLFGQGLASNQNAFGQALSGGQFTNAAQQQAAQQILQQLGLGTQLNIAQIGANTANNSLLEQIAQNNFSNSMSSRQQDISELLLQQQNPLQMYNLLTQGNGVTQPNFAQTPGSNVAGTDIASIIQQALGQQNSVYNTQVGAQNSNTAAYAAILAALLSDRRFKTNVRMIGMHEVGVPLYLFDYVWGEPGIGVMADEVAKVKPHAVITLPSGAQAVNYAEFSKVA